MPTAPSLAAMLLATTAQLPSPPQQAQPQPAVPVQQPQAPQSTPPVMPQPTDAQGATGAAPPASAATPQEAPPAAPADEEEGAEITVVGQRERGSVPGNIQPEQVLRPAEILAYGANSIDELLQTLGDQLGSGGGSADGGVVVLLNGRPISSPRSIGRYPPEAIARTEILPPEAAQQLGYAPQQRVVNIVLRQRFNTVTVETEAGGATQGDYFSAKTEAGLLRIQRGDRRFSLQVDYAGQTPVYEADRNISPVPPNRPYAILGNVTPGPGLTQIDPALSALARSVVTVAGVPDSVAGRPALGSFLGGVNPSDVANYRTLRDASRNVDLTTTYARPVGSVNLSLTGALTLNGSAGEQGLATTSLVIPTGNPFSPFGNPVTVNRYLVEGGALGRTSDRTSGRLEFALDGDAGRWRWNLIGTYNRSFRSTFTDRSFDLSPVAARIASGDPTLNPFRSIDPALLGAIRQDYARTLSNAANARLLVNGPLARLPAGDIRASVRTGFAYSDQDSRSINSGTVINRAFERRTGNGQVRLDVPITSRSNEFLSAIGDISLNGAYSFDQSNDTGWLSTYSYGIDWRPIRMISFLATVSRDENAASIEDLTDPIITTPNVRVFDFLRGTSRDVTRITGGNPALLNPERRTTNLRVSVRPVTSPSFNVSLTAEYTLARQLRPINRLGTPTAAIEAAFPDRFLRDASGELIRIDARPLNFQRSDSEEFEWRVSLFRLLGSAPSEFAGFGRGTNANRERPPRPQTPATSIGATGPEQAPVPETGTPRPAAGDTVVVQTDSAPAPPPPEQRRFEGRGPGGFEGGRGGFGGGFGGGRGFGGRSRDQVSLVLRHSWQLRNTVSIAPGVPELNLLDGDAATGNGIARHRVQLTMIGQKGPFNLRSTVDWSSGSVVRGGTLQNPNDLRFAQLTRINTVGRIDFDRLPSLVRDHDWLRATQLELSVTNLFDVRQRVVNSAGSVPINFEPDRLDPLGRTVMLSLRKQFRPRPAPRPAGVFGRGGALR